jgi:hypothetical protein
MWSTRCSASVDNLLCGGSNVDVEEREKSGHESRISRVIDGSRRKATVSRRRQVSERPVVNCVS